MLLMHVKSFQSALISCMPLLGVGTSWGFLKNQKSVPPALVLALYDGRGYVYRNVNDPLLSPLSHAACSS